MGNENPQTEDGYTRIAHELLEAIIAFNFSKRHYKIILHVIRKTYGWHKKEDVMSLSQILAATGLDRGHACNAINELCLMKVLLKRQHHKGQAIGLNKKYSEWKCYQNSNTVTTTATKCYQNGNKSVTKTATTKENSKDITKRYTTITLANFIKTCQASNIQPITDDDPIFEYAQKVGLDNAMLNVCWQEFKAQYLNSTKRYPDWRAHYRNAVRKNWFKLWFLKEGEHAQWTTTGEQARRAAA